MRDKGIDGWGKQIKIDKPTFISGEIIDAAMKLFTHHDFRIPIRNVGVRVSDLSSADTPVQADIFGCDKRRQRAERLEHAVDEIRGRFGHFAINRGTEHFDTELTRFCPRTENTIHPYSYFR